MLKISHFARIGRVSIKTLRYYDSVGLLKPARVDDLTGYRYYTSEQLPRLHHILALKDLGFSLQQIAEALRAGLAPGELQHLLCKKQAELEQRVREEQARLERVRARLRQIEQEGMRPGDANYLEDKRNEDPGD